VSAVLLFASAVQAADVPVLPFHDIEGLTVSTPIPWAYPLDGGPLDVLAIAPYSTLADIAQLKGHLEMKLETVVTWDRDHLGFDPLFPEPSYPDATYEAVEKRLAKALANKKLKVIIIGTCNPAAFPESVQQQIIDRVEAGAGLFITGGSKFPGGPLANWLSALPESPDAPGNAASAGPIGLPQQDQQRLITYHTAGEGRVARFIYQNQLPPSHCLIPVPLNPYQLNPEHESNAFSLACKTVLWAAGRQPENQVVQLIDVTPQGPNDEEIPPGYPREFIEAVRRNAFNQPLRPYVLALDGPASTTYDIVYQLRVPGAALPAWRVPSGTTIPKGESRCALEVIATPGEYFLDVWLTTRKGVVAWYTEAVTVRGWPQIASVSILQEGKDARWLHPNDHLDVQVEIEPSAFLTSGDQATVFARAVDNLGRQLASAAQVTGPEGGKVYLRLELADLIAPLVKVEVIAVPSALIADVGLAGQSARQTYYFPVRLPDPRSEPTVVLSAAGPFDYGTIRQMVRLRALTGCSVLHAPAGVEGLLAASAAGLSRLAQVGSLDAGHVAAGEVRVPCLSSEAHWTRETERIHSGVLESWAGGTPWYSLGAGAALTATEANLCQSPDCLAEFTAILRESYANLNALNRAWNTDFTTWEQVSPLALDQCQQGQRWAPWLDFRQAMAQVFARAVARGRDSVLDLPGAGRVGFQSPPSPITPLAGYDWRRLSSVTDFITSPAEPYAMRRLQSYQAGRPYAGVVVGVPQLEDNPVDAARLPWECVLHQIPTIWLDKPIGQGAKDFLTPSGAPKPGLDGFTSALDAVHGGIGALILNAIPQPTGIAFVDSTASRYLDFADPDPKRSSEAAETWLSNAINRSGFTARVHALGDPLQGINTLILSRCRVLSNDEIHVLEAFHDQGGLILADGPAGAFDSHGQIRPRPPLPFLHPLENKEPGDDVALWTNRPVWVGSSDASASIQDILSQLLTRAGNEPGLSLHLPDKQQGQVERFQYTFGAATIVACLPAKNIDTTLRRAGLRVPDGYFGHALLSLEESQTRRRLQWTIAPNEPAVFSLLPYRVKDLLIEAPELVIAGQRLAVAVHLDTGDAVPGDHFITLRLNGPDGEELSHYRQALRMENGHVTTYLPLAENEVPGYYTLVASDVLTRQSKSVTVEIQ